MACHRLEPVFPSPERTASDAAGWFDAATDAWLLGMEAAQVIGVRLSQMAMGKAPAAEAALMVAEKVAAAMEVGSRLYSGALGSTPLSVAEGTISHYRVKIRANRRRLEN